MKQIGIVTIVVGVALCVLGIFDPTNAIIGQKKETAVLYIGGVVAVVGLLILVYGVNKKD
jgi:hypothetical protein